VVTKFQFQLTRSESAVSRTCFTGNSVQIGHVITLYSAFLVDNQTDAYVGFPALLKQPPPHSSDVEFCVEAFALSVFVLLSNSI
jgi:hypothetical protein